MIKKFFLSTITTIGRLHHNFIARVRNWVEYKQKRISRFEYELRKKYLACKNSNSMGEFYQSYPPLHIRGMRPTMSRFKLYKMKKHLSKNKTVLDVGGNTGFFSSYLSEHVNHVTVLEIDTGLAGVGEMLVKHEKIDNVTFVNKAFLNYKTTKQYDIILSLAVHYYMGCSLDDYLKKIKKLLKKDGKLLFETHKQEWNNDRTDLSLIKKHFIVIESDYIDDSLGQIRKYYWCKKK